MKIELAKTKTPLGEARIAVVDGAVRALTLRSGWPETSRGLTSRSPHAEISTAKDPAGIVSAVRDYFDGDMRAFDSLRISSDGTPFQETVWRALRRIPPGRTLSYGELARAARKPTAIRAVGTAMASNPIWIIQPCHRVLRSDGSLGGYAGGVTRKRWLLQHERDHAAGN